MASEDDRRSMQINNFLTPASHQVNAQQQYETMQQPNHHPDASLRTFSYNTRDRGSFAPISPYHASNVSHQVIQHNDGRQPFHHESNTITPLMIPPPRRIPSRPSSRNTTKTFGSFADDSLFQDVATRERYLDATIQDMAPQPLSIPTGVADDDLESGMSLQDEDIRTITLNPPTSWTQPPVQDVSSQQSLTASHSIEHVWGNDAITLFPSPTPLSQLDTTSLPPDISFCYDNSTVDDREVIRSPNYPTPLPILVYYHSKGYRYRTEQRRQLQTVWRLEVREGYAGAFQEWNFALAQGWYEFECCDNPIVILGQHHHGTVHMFSYQLNRQSQFRRQGIITPVAPNSSPSPCYLDSSLNRAYRIGGFLHPWMYGVPGDHQELHLKSGREFYLPMDVFASEGVIACRSWAAKHCITTHKLERYIKTQGISTNYPTILTLAKENTGNRKTLVLKDKITEYIMVDTIINNNANRNSETSNVMNIDTKTKEQEKTNKKKEREESKEKKKHTNYQQGTIANNNMEIDDQSMSSKSGASTMTIQTQHQMNRKTSFSLNNNSALMGIATCFNRCFGLDAIRIEMNNKLDKIKVTFISFT